MFANVITKKIEMTKAEAVKAGKIGSEKYEELNTLMNRFPTFEISIVKTSTKSIDHLKSGFTPTEIMYAFRKKIYKDIESREKHQTDPDDGLEIKITSEVKKK